MASFRSPNLSFIHILDARASLAECAARFQMTVNGSLRT